MSSPFLMGCAGVAASVLFGLVSELSSSVPEFEASVTHCRSCFSTIGFSAAAFTKEDATGGSSFRAASGKLDTMGGGADGRVGTEDVALPSWSPAVALDGASFGSATFVWGADPELQCLLQLTALETPTVDLQDPPR